MDILLRNYIIKDELSMLRKVIGDKRQEIRDDRQIISNTKRKIQPKNEDCKKMMIVEKMIRGMSNTRISQIFFLGENGETANQITNRLKENGWLKQIPHNRKKKIVELVEKHASRMKLNNSVILEMKDAKKNNEKLPKFTQTSNPSLDNN